MTQKINHLTIGAFVVGALILLLLFLIFFSGANLFTHKERVVMYFDGSVQGLKIGAPVKLKGAELGQIVDIEVTFLSDNLSIVNTVTADIILKRIRQDGEQFNDDIFDAVIEKGLRAQLNYQSLLTGQLYIELDFYPKSELHLHKLQIEYREFLRSKLISNRFLMSLSVLMC
jgi:paraquat-inducible protein B